jgi:hypothetical protein
MTTAPATTFAAPKSAARPAPTMRSTPSTSDASDTSNASVGHSRKAPWHMDKAHATIRVPRTSRRPTDMDGATDSKKPDSARPCDTHSVSTIRRDDCRPALLSQGLARSFRFQGTQKTRFRVAGNATCIISDRNGRIAQTRGERHEINLRSFLSVHEKRGHRSSEDVRQNPA